MSTLPLIVTDIKSDRPKLWKAISEMHQYGEWNSLVPYVAGNLAADNELRVTMVLPGEEVQSGPCKVEAVKEGEYFILSRKMIFNWLLYLEHGFIIQPINPEKGEFKFIQSLECSGLLLPLLKRQLKNTWKHFRIMNEDLKNYLEGKKDGN